MKHIHCSKLNHRREAEKQREEAKGRFSCFLTGSVEDRRNHYTTVKTKKHSKITQKTKKVCPFLIVLLDRHTKPSKKETYFYIQKLFHSKKREAREPSPCLTALDMLGTRIGQLMTGDLHSISGK